MASFKALIGNVERKKVRSPFANTVFVSKP